jgi:hypothetical protein
MRGMPLQNSLVIGAILFAGELAMERIDEASWSKAIALAAVWSAATVAARFVARGLLAGLGIRAGRYYGLAVMLIAAGLAALAQMLDADFCTRLACAMRIRFCVTFLLLLVTAPWFIRKEQFSNPPAA